MLDFKKYFLDQYQFTLEKAVYSRIESNHQGGSLELNISDSIHSSIRERRLHVTFERSVYFSPEALYKVDVAFSFELTFNDTISADEMISTNWNTALVETDNPYLRNVVSRAAALIGAITSSYGQQPLITPPQISGSQVNN